MWSVTRLERREGDASDADWEIHDEIARRWEEVTPRIKAVTRWIDTGASADAAVLGAIEALMEFGLFGR